VFDLTFWLYASSPGILVIFGWRIIAKSTLHVVLPPVFRLLAQGFTLPNRRFYTPATDYKNVPSEFGSGGVLRPIPSVIDLPGELEVGVDADWGAASSGRRPAAIAGFNTKMRSNGNGSAQGRDKGEKGWELEKNEDRYANGKQGETVKHYDADGGSFFFLTASFPTCGSCCLLWLSPDKGDCVLRYRGAGDRGASCDV
jgi:hypothetical protein